MRRLTAILVLSLCGPVLAETAYVTDKLRLGVHRAADTSDEPFVFLDSGDSMEILERTRFYARVRLPSGEEGWVRVAYLVSEEPARRRAVLLEQERDALASELENFKSTISDRLARLEELEEQVKSRSERRRAELAELDELHAANEKLTASLELYRFSIPVIWFLGICAAAVILTCAGTWWWLDRRSRSRHGGFRVH